MNTPRNILFIFPLPFHPERGGVERVTDILARELARRGHRIFYLHKPVENQSYEDYDPPAKVVYLPMRRLASKGNLRFYHQFLREHKIHIIINQMGLSDNYSPFTRPPRDAEDFPRSISVMHNPPLMHYDHFELSEKNSAGPLGRLFTPLRKWLYKHTRVRELRHVAQSCDCICVLTHAFNEQLRKLRIAEKTHCKLHTLANPCTFAPVATMPEKRHHLLYVSRLDANQKAPQRLIPIWKQLFQRFPDWELVIVGDGPYRSTLEQEAASLPRIRLEGYQTPTPYFRDAAILCLTSNYEGFPMVLLEGMCNGAVPIAFNSFPALGELLEGHMDKLAATPFDTNDFADKLAWLMEHEEERLQLAQACIAKSAQYTIASITDQWESLFEEVRSKS